MLRLWEDSISPDKGTECIGGCAGVCSRPLSLERGGFAISDDKTTTLIAGTGKYKGITETVSYTMRELHDTVGDRKAFVVNHKAKWEIK